MDFLSNIFDKFIHLAWVEWTINYCKTNPVMAGIVGGLVLLIIVVLSIISHRCRKARKAKKAAKAVVAPPAEEVVEEKAEPAPVEETPVEKEECAQPVSPIEEETIEAPVEEEASVEPIPAPIEEVEEPAPAPVEEKKEEPAPAPVEEKKEEPAPAPVEEKKEEPAPAPVVKTEAERAEPQSATAKEAVEALALADEVDEDEEDDPLRDHYDEDETDRIARYKGKWVICRVLTDDEDSEEMYFFELHASNGEKLLASEEYTTYQGALRGIQTHKSNILNGNLKITLSKKGDYIFKLLSGKNMLLCMGENYPTRARCESALNSTIRFAATAIIDENVQDIVIKVPHEDDSPIEPLPEGYAGKWLISSGLSAEGAKIFYFELFANNGEKLLTSEDYTTYIGAVNGIQTHKKNISLDNFRISLTKRGDYIYKLLNGNGQLLCLGEHYKTKRLCQSAVDSVKRFAMNSPILTEEKEN